MQLVEVVKNEIVTDSITVARKFKLKHKDVVSNIQKLNGDINKLRGDGIPPKPQEVVREYRGVNFTAYLMTREYFSLLSMRFKGEKALEWQIKFNKAFYVMEESLLKADLNKQDRHWLASRENGKLARKDETDVIKEFVEYAKAQGSTKAGFYYKHITTATYKALGLMEQKYPKLRDTMNFYELSELVLAERLATQSLKKYMELGRDYHDIYESVKADLFNFADSMRISVEHNNDTH